MKITNICEKKEKAIKTLPGIDSLYFFVDTMNCEFYQDLFKKANETNNLNGYEFLNYSGKNSGFIGVWFLKKNDRGLPLYRIGFKDGSKQHNIHNIFVQLYAGGIYFFGGGFKSLTFFLEQIAKDISSLLFGFPIDWITQFIVSRIDINMFVSGYDFSNFRSSMFKARVKKSAHIYSEKQDKNDFEYLSTDRLETLYLGSKRSDVVFKLYDKKVELSKNCNISNFQKETYLTIFGLLPNNELWNIEFSLKRKALKEYSIFTVFDALKASDLLWRDLMMKYVFVGFDVEKIQEFKKKNYLRKLDIHPLWKLLLLSYNFSLNTGNIKRNYVKRDDLPSIEYFLRDLNLRVGKIKNLGIEITSDQILKCLNIA